MEKSLEGCPLVFVLDSLERKKQEGFNDIKQSDQANKSDFMSLFLGWVRIVYSGSGLFFCND